MKNNLKFLTSLAIAVCTAGPVMAAGEHDHAPKNGGIVVESKVGDLEIVAKPDLLQIFITANRCNWTVPRLKSLY